MSFFYFSRIILFVAIFFLIRYVSALYGQDYIVKYIFIWPFVIHFIISFGIVFHYFLTHSPSLSYIMWGYDVGIRMLPISGLTIDPGSEYFLIAKRGSHNILASWSVLILLLGITYEGKIKYRKWLLLIATLTPFLAMSRGGVLTVGIIWLFYFAISSKISFVNKTLLLSFFLLTALILFYGSDFLGIAIPNIFERFSRTFEEGQFDSSTLGRFENYRILFNYWTENIITILFGMGFDPVIVRTVTSESRFESFFLQVLFNGGLFSFFWLVILFLKIYIDRKNSYWSRLLFLFVLFESFVMWSVTGADFWAPQILFLLMILFGLVSNIRPISREFKEV